MNKNLFKQCPKCLQPIKSIVKTKCEYCEIEEEDDEYEDHIKYELAHWRFL